MSLSYEQNLAMLNASYEAAEQFRRIASQHPDFKEIIEYTEVGPRLLMLHFSSVSHDNIYRHGLTSTHVLLERLLYTAQMDDFGNMCWSDVYAYHWEGYFPYLVRDFSARGLEGSDLDPYVLHVPTCH